MAGAGASTTEQRSSSPQNVAPLRKAWRMRVRLASLGCSVLIAAARNKKARRGREMPIGNSPGPLPRLFQIPLGLVRPRNSPPPVVVPVAIAIAIGIVPSIIVVAPSPVAIFTMIFALISIGLGDHAQLPADL